MQLLNLLETSGLGTVTGTLQVSSILLLNSHVSRVLLIINLHRSSERWRDLFKVIQLVSSGYYLNISFSDMSTGARNRTPPWRGSQSVPSQTVAQSPGTARGGQCSWRWGREALWQCVTFSEALRVPHSPPIPLPASYCWFLWSLWIPESSTKQRKDGWPSPL